MFCRNCGKEIEEGRFCPFCGTACDTDEGRRHPEERQDVDVTVHLSKEPPVTDGGQTEEKKAEPEAGQRETYGTKRKRPARGSGKGARIAACLLAVFLLLSLGGNGMLGFVLIGLYNQNQYLEKMMQSYGYLEEEEYEEVIRTCGEAIELAPERKEAYLLSAEASMEQNQIEPAIEVLEQAAAVEGMDKAVEERLRELKDLQEDVPTLEELGITEEELSEYGLSLVNSLNQIVEQELQEQYASDETLASGLAEWEEMFKTIGEYQDAAFRKAETDWRGVHILLEINGGNGTGTLEFLLNRELVLEEIHANA